MRSDRSSPCAGGVVGVEGLEPRRLLAATPVPLGPETPVNTTAESDQAMPAVAADGAGGFVVAWQSVGQDGSGAGVYARRYDDAGPAGPEFRANTQTALGQSLPAAAASPGGFVVVWQSEAQDGDSWGVYGQLYDAAGAPRGDEFPVNDWTAGRQTAPAVAMAPDGRFVVAWSDFGADGEGLGVFARRFAADGTPQGPQFPVNTTLSLDQFGASVGMAADGSFVVAWEGRVEPDGYGVFARRFDAAGPPLGGEFRVDADARPNVREPSVGVGPDGDFVVAWQSPGDAAGAGVYAQQFSADGAARGDALPVAAGPGAASPAVSVAPGGGFAVAWQADGPGGAGLDVFARRFGADGAASDEIPVNTHAVGDQVAAALAFAPGGSFLVAWQSAGQDGSGLGVYAQHFCAGAAPPPVVTGVFVAGSSWAAAFRTAVGGAGPGYLVPGGAAQLDELPWTNLNQVSVRFSIDVSVAEDDLAVMGRGGSAYSISGFEYRRESWTATWTLSRAMANDRVELLLDGGAGGVKAATSGPPPNGRRFNGNDDDPTGDLGPPQSLLFRLNVLPGDVTRDGAVDAADVERVRSGRAGGTGRGYRVFHDVNGSGRVDAVDYALVRSRQGTTLPTTKAPAVGGKNVVAPRIVPVRRQLFSTTAILA